MNTNVIVPASVSIPCGKNGSLSIIGEIRCDTVVVMARAEELYFLPMRPHMITFADKVVSTWINGDSDQGLVIFEYSIGQEIRNPRKLLKSIRNKLMGAAQNAKHEEFKEQQEESLYWHAV